jgi:hypothetical protein
LLQLANRAGIAFENLHPTGGTPRVSATSVQDIAATIVDGQNQLGSFGNFLERSVFKRNFWHGFGCSSDLEI